MNKGKDSTELRVLIVDDDEPLRRFLRQILTQSGYTVAEAKSSAGALQQLQGLTPDLILLDYVLPDMNGLQLLEKIRSLPRLVQVPIIYLTGKNDIPAKTRALENGAVDYVTKPFDPRELLARIARHIRLKHQLQETETRLAEVALRDPVTGLGNRKRFSQRVSTLVGESSSQAGSQALIFIDIDNFKLINDTKGHASGDEALIFLANNLRRVFGDSDAIYRVGGDEFCVILVNANSQRALELGEQLMQAIHEKSTDFAGLTLSAGIAMIEPGIDAEELVSRADSALYAAKAAGKNQCFLYRSDNEELIIIRSEAEWFPRIKEGLRQQRFQIYYQPIVELRSGRVYCQEALIRYIGDNGLRHLPGEFLPAAERFNLMLELDRYMVRRVLSEFPHRSGEKIAINLSGQSVSKPELCDFIRSALREADVDPKRVVFEITETAFIKNLNQAHALVTELRKLGCTFSLDDFGSGFSSLSYLRNLPVDVVKIDGSFLKNITTDSVDLALLRSINEIAHLLGKRTVAEYVSSENIRQLLNEIGIDYGQGYHFGRPAPLGSLSQLGRNWS
jgi:diguanylate cyclase (GGDEF)-like protein